MTATKGLAHFWRDCLRQQADQLNLGMQGDTLKLDVASLQQEPEGLIAGPPCQRCCCLQGARASKTTTTTAVTAVVVGFLLASGQDARCEVWEQTVEMVIHFAHRGSLMFSFWKTARP